MKLSPASIALCALFVVAPAAFGQLYVTTIDVNGLNYGVTSRFTFTVNPTTNALIIDVDNTVVSDTGYIGTITSFGFNTPFTDAQLGTNGSNVSFTQLWTAKNWGHTTAKWHKFEPYAISQNGGYTEDLGVGTGKTPTGGSPQTGIEFGEKVRFTFTFPDFTPQQINGFFDAPGDLVVRWQEVGSYNHYYCQNGFSDYGWGDIPPTPEPSTYGLMGVAALLGIVAYRRRSQKKQAAAKL
ncbi:hypothetical protein DB347_24790 [Opitutaceae bacterium EW11]|nr:hypothetical protein DB347_24790 [Opitutaceae bacterium EW11]